MDKILKQSTSVVISFGPFLDKTTGVDNETGLVSALDHSSTGIMLSKNGGTLAVRHATVTASSYDAHGCYKVTLDATDTGTLGKLRVIYTDAANVCPVWEDYEVVPAVVYDALVAGSDNLDINVAQFGGTNLTASGGIPEVKVASLASNTITSSVIQDAAITNAKFALDTVVRNLQAGTAQGGAGNTITLASSAVATNAYYDGHGVMIVSGTGVGQSRVINNYVGATRIATLTEGWAVTPDATSVYVVFPIGDVEVGVNNDKTGYGLATNAVNSTSVQDGALTAAKFASGAFDAVWSVAARTLTSFGTLTTDTASSVWSAVTRTLSSFGSLSNDTATAVWVAGGRTLSSFGFSDDIATAVWGAGTRTLTAFGFDSAIATAVWGAGTRTLTSGAAPSVNDIWTHTSRTLTSGAAPSVSDIRTELEGAGTHLTLIKAKTDTIPANPAAVGSNMGTVTSVTNAVTVGTNNDKTGYSLATAPPTAGEIDTQLSLTHGSGTWGGGTTPPTKEEIRAEIDANSTRLQAIEADTNELQTDWHNGGRLDLILDGIASTGITLTPQNLIDIADAVWDELLITSDMVNYAPARNLLQVAGFALSAANGASISAGSLKKLLSVVMGSFLLTPNGCDFSDVNQWSVTVDRDLPDGAIISACMFNFDTWNNANWDDDPFTITGTTGGNVIVKAENGPNQSQGRSWCFCVTGPIAEGTTVTVRMEQGLIGPFPRIFTFTFPSINEAASDDYYAPDITGVCRNCGVGNMMNSANLGGASTEDIREIFGLAEDQDFRDEVSYAVWNRDITSWYDNPDTAGGMLNAAAAGGGGGNADTAEILAGVAALLAGDIKPSSMQSRAVSERILPRTIVRGDSFILTFVLGDDIDISGSRIATLCAKRRKTDLNEDAIVNRVCTITDRNAKTGYITLTAEETSEVGTYYVEIEITDADGSSNPQTAYSEKWSIIQDVRQ